MLGREATLFCRSQLLVLSLFVWLCVWLLCFHLLFLKELLLLLILLVEVVFEGELAEQVEVIERQSSWNRAPDIAAEHAIPLFVDLSALNRGLIQLQTDHIVELRNVEHGGQWDEEKIKVDMGGMWREVCGVKRRKNG